MPKTTRKKTDPVEQLVRLMMPVPDLEEAIGGDTIMGAGAAWEDICEHVRAGKEPADTVSLFEAIQGGLTQPLKSALLKFDKARLEELETEREAAYLVGVAVGRRLAGGAR